MERIKKLGLLQKSLYFLLGFLCITLIAASLPKTFTDGIKTKTLQYFNATELTIATGVITPTQAYHSIDTEGDAATDDLDTITATNFSAGSVIEFKQANSSRSIVFKNGTGNIVTGQTDYTLQNGIATTFIYDGTNWLLKGGGGGGGVNGPGSSTTNGIALFSEPPT